MDADHIGISGDGGEAGANAGGSRVTTGHPVLPVGILRWDDDHNARTRGAGHLDSPVDDAGAADRLVLLLAAETLAATGSDDDRPHRRAMGHTSGG